MYAGDDVSNIRMPHYVKPDFFCAYAFFTAKFTQSLINDALGSYRKNVKVGNGAIC